MPYADPDLAGLQRAGREADLDVHLARGQSVYAATVESTPSAGLFAAGAALAQDFADRAAKRGLRYAFVSAEHLRRGEATPTAGVYRSAKTAAHRSSSRSASTSSLRPPRVAVCSTRCSPRPSPKRRPAALPVVAEIGPASGHASDSLLSAQQSGRGRAMAPSRDRGASRRPAAATPHPLELVRAPPCRTALHQPTSGPPSQRRGATRRAYASAAPKDDQDAATRCRPTRSSRSAPAGPGRMAIRHSPTAAGTSLPSALRRSKDDIRPDLGDRRERDALGNARDPYPSASRTAMNDRSPSASRSRRAGRRAPYSARSPSLPARPTSPSRSTSESR